MKKSQLLFMIICLSALFCLQSSLAQAPPSEGTEATAPQGKEVTLWDSVRAGGVIGIMIIISSVIAVGLIADHFIMTRRSKFFPPELQAQVELLLEETNIQGAVDTCEVSPSLLGKVLGAGLRRCDGMFGFFDMQTAMQETGEREGGRMYRKLEYLSFIGATTPMLGLLGTVTGMIKAFNVISLSGGTAKPAQLAGGISEALVTTCMGLIVAIPTMFFVSYFRNQIESGLTETEAVCEKLTSRFRQGGQG
jgi:biopolymer transport protein ExbB